MELIGTIPAHRGHPTRAFRLHRLERRGEEVGGPSGSSRTDSVRNRPPAQAPRRGQETARGAPKPRCMTRGQLEQRLLVLVTLGLVAFGLVMVYSATSAAAAVGGGDPSGFLEAPGASTRSSASS